MRLDVLRMGASLAFVALAAAGCDGSGNPDPGGPGRDGPGPGEMQVDAGVTEGGGGGGGGGATDAGAPTACVGDWSLGSTPFHGDDIGGACDPHNAPQNCATGDFIMFDSTGECICIAACSDFVDVGLGDACTDDGSWTCQHIQASGGNHGEYCVPNAWNLCTR